MITLQLHPDWKRILRFAWSVRLISLAGVLEVVAAYLLFTIQNNPVAGWVLVLAAIVNVAALISRVVAQKDVHV